MLFRFVFVLFLLSFAPSKTYAGWCHKDCGSGDTCTSDYIQKNNLYSNTTAVNGAHACNTKYQMHGETTSVRIGWGDTCATPSGDDAPDQSTCLTTHNLLGKVIDVILTVGIAEVMFNQYCSFSAGDPALEGGIISNDLLSQCSGEDTLKKRKKCMACIFKGLSYDRTDNECVSTGGTLNPPFNVANYIQQDSNICAGIPNTERPVIGSDGKMVTYEGDVVYCPMMRCNIPTNYIRTKYFLITNCIKLGFMRYCRQ